MMKKKSKYSDIEVYDMKHGYFPPLISMAFLAHPYLWMHLFKLLT